MPDKHVVAQEQVQKQNSSSEVGSFEADEQALEALPESADTFLEKELPAEQTVTPQIIEGVSVTPAPSPSPAPKDDVTLRVEKIMEDGLGSYYDRLSPQAKVQFKRKGEETAVEISLMVRSLKVKMHRVLRLLRDWLLTIPGVNKFFLEQEAKIKTDRILELVEARKEEFSQHQ